MVIFLRDTHQIIQFFVVRKKWLIILLFAFDETQNLTVEIVIIGGDYAVREFFACFKQERYQCERMKERENLEVFEFEKEELEESRDAIA